MGWDAYAYRSVEDALLSLDSYDPKPHLDPEMRQVFEKANFRLRKQIGDGGEIIDGELGGSLSRRCLSLATPISCSTAGSERGVLCWSPETVQQANALADWGYRIEDEPYSNEDDPEDERWIRHAKCEAQIFLEICSHHGYAILFTE